MQHHYANLLRHQLQPTREAARQNLAIIVQLYLSHLAGNSTASSFPSGAGQFPPGWIQEKRIIVLSLAAASFLSIRMLPCYRLTYPLSSMLSKPDVSQQHQLLYRSWLAMLLLKNRLLFLLFISLFPQVFWQFDCRQLGCGTGRDGRTGRGTREPQVEGKMRVVFTAAGPMMLRELAAGKDSITAGGEESLKSGQVTLLEEATETECGAFSGFAE